MVPTRTRSGDEGGFDPITLGRVTEVGKGEEIVFLITINKIINK